MTVTIPTQAKPGFPERLIPHSVFVWADQFEIDMELEFFRLTMTAELGSLEDEIAQEYVAGEYSVPYERMSEITARSEIRHLKEDATVNTEYDSDPFENSEQVALYEADSGE